MNNETCTVTIADIYGAEWWDRNKAELDREWEWEFVKNNSPGRFNEAFYGEIIGHKAMGVGNPAIILHRRKPKPPTLRDVYGVDEVTIPQGWEWTGEWRKCVDGESYISALGDRRILKALLSDLWAEPRLILRERQKKVWFKAEEKDRLPRKFDWFWCGDKWRQAKVDFKEDRELCATRHEEIDDTVQVVTQADVDKAVWR